MVDEPLCRTLLRYKFQCRVFDILDIQKFIPYHICMINRGDRGMREDFRFLQKWYGHHLNLSVGQVRAYMERIDLGELQGYAVPPISRPYDEDDDEETAAELALSTPTPDELEDLSRADEEIMVTMGFHSREELEDFFSNNVPAHPKPVIAAPCPAAGDAAGYDDSGFYMGEEETDDGKSAEMREDGSLPAMETSDTPSSPPAQEGGSPPSTSPAPSDRSSGSLDPCGLIIDSSALGGPDQRPSTPGLAPLSDELRDLLREIGGDPDAKKATRAVVLTELELDAAGKDWAETLEEVKWKEARRLRAANGAGAGIERGRGRGRGLCTAETWEEADYLDGWDQKHRQFNWQSEGIFLCRLTQLFFKDSFERARAVFWLKEGDGAGARRGGARYVQPPGSPLRNQLPQ